MVERDHFGVFPEILRYVLEHLESDVGGCLLNFGTEGAESADGGIVAHKKSSSIVAK